MKKYINKKFIDETLFTIVGAAIIGTMGYILFWFVGEIISHI